MKKSTVRGFTIVELLIVVVVIAVLAAITTVAYNGIQKRARDGQRKQDIAAIQKALEMYYIDNNEYPPGSGSTSINGSWSTTADGSWANLETELKPYLSKLPADPISTPNQPLSGTTGYNYSYFADQAGTYCSTTRGQVYILNYHLENETSVQTMDACPVGNTVGPYSGNTIRRVK